MELFYVREGVINDYALDFNVPVPSIIGSLNFNWMSLANRPVSLTRNYFKFLNSNKFIFSCRIIWMLKFPIQ